MTSDRIQRQIDRLLDEAEAAIGNRDWGAVRDSAQAVLRLDPENKDDLGFLGSRGALGDGGSVPLGKQVADPAGEAGEETFGGKDVVFLEAHRLRPGLVAQHAVSSGVEHPDLLGARIEPLLDLLGDLVGTVVGRYDLYREVRRQLDIPRGQKAAWQPVLADERRVGRPHRVRVSAEDEARLGAEHLPDAEGFGVISQPPVCPARRSSVFPAGWWHLDQFSFQELIPPSVVRHAEELFCGHELSLGGHHTHPLSCLDSSTGLPSAEAA